ALIEQARADVRRAAAHDGPVLVHGEPGTEKQAVARMLHRLGVAREQPFLVVNPASGRAREPADGASDESRAGTLFIPDLAALDPGGQLELVQRLSALGAGAERPPRIIVGLGHPPGASWEASGPRRLFDSLGATRVALPPLRERGRDVVILAEHIAEQVRLERGDASLRITRAALEALMAHGWPGNVDELRAAIQHAASLCIDSTIEVSDLPACIALGVRGPADQSGLHLQVRSL